ncbi:hypothetical protein GCM10007383_32280 [Arenibacter certesii]|uniref:Uncharacterized protein n=2 Tax=Arenibacter certesii TaxID=228955 RepID=A0A918J3Z2_9FLAO|nr:hypothetical protein GCM10007383_32280 [Arenibacter certesii]
MAFTTDKMNKESTMPAVVSDVSLKKEIKENNNSQFSKSAEETAIYLSLLGDRQQLGSDPNYTRSVMVQLINMVRTTALEYHLKMDDKLETLKESSLTIRNNTTASNLIIHINSAGKEVSEVITQLQVQKFPDLSKETERVHRAVNKIDPTIALKDQKEEIKEFFVSCGDAIKKMDLSRK